MECEKGGFSIQENPPFFVRLNLLTEKKINEAADVYFFL